MNDMCQHSGCCFCPAQKGLTDLRRADAENGPSAEDVWAQFCPTRLCPCCVTGHCEHAGALLTVGK